MLKYYESLQLQLMPRLHHGRIWADSEGPSHGSTFTFSLPDITNKNELLKMEEKADIKKEQLKPLARPVKQAEDI